MAITAPIIVAWFLWTPVYALISQNSGYELLSSVVASGGEYYSGGNYAVRGALAQDVSSSHFNFTKSSNYSNRSGFYNPPYFTYQKPLPVYFKNSFMQLNVPDNSVEKEVFDIFLNRDVNKSPNKEKITEANLKIQMKDPLSYPLIFSEVYFMDEESLYKDKLKSAGEISFKFSDANGDGNIDRTSPPVRLSSLRGYILDEDYSIWLKTFENDVNVIETSLKFVFTRPSIYAILGQILSEVKNIYVFPVPFRPNGPNAGNGAGQTGTESEGITFANIPQTGDIEIYTIDGRVVRKIEIPLDLVVSKIKWDVKNSSGEKVVSGVYIWRVVSGGDSKTGKLIIIR
jgi:hypothetical protein